MLELDLPLVNLLISGQHVGGCLSGQCMGGYLEVPFT